VGAHVLSAPVMDHQSGKVVGFLDLKDLVSYVCLNYDYYKKQHKPEHDKKVHPVVDHKAQTLSVFLDGVLHEGWDGPTVRPRDPSTMITVKYLSGRNRFVPVDDTASLLDVANLLKNKDVHRVPIVDKDRKLVDIISQSAVVNLVQKNAAKFQDVLGHPLEQVGLSHKQVVTVHEKSPAIDCFKVLNTKNLYGVGVVDDQGSLVGQTSSSDLKLWLANPVFQHLDMPIVEWLNVIRRQNLVDKPPVIVVQPNDTLGHTIGKLAATKMHRIFVVDDKRRPLGVVSLRDVLAKLLQ